MKVDPNILSSYQNPEGLLQDRLAPRTDLRKELLSPHLGIVSGKTVLDIGCNNGYFTREAKKRGARTALGVDVSDAVKGARLLSAGTGAQFWQVDVDSKEFRRFCPVFDVVFLFSVLTHVRDKEEFLDWLDSRIRYALIFESNHGEKNKAHIELIKKHMYFESIEYLGPSDIPEKPHHLWICRKWNHEQRYTFLQGIPVEFVPIVDIQGWDEQSVYNQRGGYGMDDERAKALLEDIRRRGIREPLILQEKEGVLRGFQGAHRYLAAKKLGCKEVPCKVVRGLWFKHLKK